MHTAPKSVQILLEGNGTILKLAMFEGVEPAALAHAVAAWAGLPNERGFFLKAANSSSGGAVVPLSYCLPDGMELVLHRSPVPEAKCSAVGAPYSDDPQEAQPAYQRQLSPVEERQGSKDAAQNSPRLGDDVVDNAHQSNSASSTSPGRARSSHGTSRSPPAVPSSSPSRKGRNDIERGREIADDRGAQSTHSSRSQSSSLRQPLLGKQAASAPNLTGMRTGRRFSTGGFLKGSSTMDLGGVEEPPSHGRDRVLSQDAIMQAAMFDRVNAMERFGRLSTDLANERTLLAYVRVTLAAIRTSFAYVDLHLADSTELWRFTVLLSEVMMTTLVVVTAIFGAHRYYKLKDIIMQKVPPRHFGRISLRPLTFLVIATTTSTGIGIYVQAWNRS